jgi:hypothetical protein
MNLDELRRHLQLEIRAARGELNREVTCGYASDLLSYAMAKARTGCVWVTLQGHVNIVAVASLADATGVIITEGLEPDADTIEKANAEGIPILTTDLTTFAVAGRMFELGIPGVDDLD